MNASVKPFVRILFVCAKANQDADGGWLLHEPLTIVSPLEDFPMSATGMAVYAHVAGGVGDYEIHCEVRHLPDNQPPRTIGWSSAVQVSFPADKRIQAFEWAYTLKKISFKEAGIYEFRLMCDNEELPGMKAELRIVDGSNSL